MKRIQLFAVVLFTVITVFSCKKDNLSQSEQLAKDIGIIEQYLTDNDLTAQSTASGLHYIITDAGNGTFADINSTVEVKYRGYFIDGKTFDQTPPNKTIILPLANVIEGWQEGIPLIPEGGSGILLIPSKLGYGPQGNSSIPGNTVLLFDVDVVDVQ